MIQRSEKSIKVWDAYGELFTLYCTQNNLKLDALGKVLTEDAKQHASVRCKYSKRSLELYKVKPKTGRKYREMRPYRREHLHVFFSEYLRDCGKAHEYADYLAAIAPPAGSPTKPDEVISGIGDSKLPLMVSSRGSGGSLVDCRAR